MKDSFIRKAVPPAKNEFRWVAGVGAGSKEKRVARRSISLAGFMELRIHVSVSAIMSGL